VVAPNKKGWELGVTSIRLSDAGKSILGTFDDSGVMAVQEIHRDHVTVLPPSFLVLGHSALTPVQGLIFMNERDAEKESFDVSKARVLTFQGHPEFTKDISVEIIEAIDKLGLANKGLTAQGKRRAGDRDDGRKVGRSVWKFLGVNACSVSI